MFRIKFLLLSLLWTFFAAAGEPEAVYLTWQNDPTSTMTIQWITKNDDETAEVEYQLLDAKEWMSCTGVLKPLPQEEPYTVHLVEIVDLQPKTSYRFRIKNCEKTHLFRTMPASLAEPILFTVGGDTNQVDCDLFARTNKKAASFEPLFTIFGGDLAYAAPHDVEKKEDAQRWLDWISSYSSSMITPSGYKIPLIACIGNHDVKGWLGKGTEDAAFFYTLLATPGLPGYKALQFGDYMSLFLLDSNHSNPIKGKQADWLREVLAKFSDTPHRFAVYHVAAYPSVRSFRTKEGSQIRRYWVPLFEKYHLSAAFEHNDHAYKRTFPLMDDAPHPQGILYLGDGAWAAKPRQPKKAQSTTYLAKTKASQHFIKVQLSETEREYTAITPDGEIIDHYVQFIK